MRRAAMLSVVTIVGLTAGAALTAACESVCGGDTTLQAGRYALEPEFSDEFHADNYVLTLTGDRRFVTRSSTSTESTTSSPTPREARYLGDVPHFDEIERSIRRAGSWAHPEQAARAHARSSAKRSDGSPSAPCRHRFCGQRATYVKTDAG